MVWCRSAIHLRIAPTTNRAGTLDLWNTFFIHVFKFKLSTKSRSPLARKVALGNNIASEASRGAGATSLSFKRAKSLSLVILKIMLVYKYDRIRSLLIRTGHNPLEISYRLL